MPAIPGPGPVFAYEWLTSSRRWRSYATRSLFAVVLLIALGMSWGSPRPWAASINQAQAYLAMRAYYAVVGTQPALVLLAAPAATAGSICIDKARGTMAHVLVTDLSAAEVVLGKLAARLVPVLGLIGCPRRSSPSASCSGGSIPPPWPGPTRSRRRWRSSAARSPSRSRSGRGRRTRCCWRRI